MKVIWKDFLRWCWEKKNSMIVWLFEIDRTKPRAPPWARLLQDENEFEKRRVVEERRRGIYRMSTQVRTKTKTRCSPEHLSSHPRCTTGSWGLSPGHLADCQGVNTFLTSYRHHGCDWAHNYSTSIQEPRQKVNVSAKFSETTSLIHNPLNFSIFSPFLPRLIWPLQWHPGFFL